MCIYIYIYIYIYIHIHLFVYSFIIKQMYTLCMLYQIMFIVLLYACHIIE